MNLEKLAREAGLSLMTADAHCREDYYTATRQELATLYALIRAEVLEEAAKHFDARDNGIGFYDPHEPAEIIRALKDKK